MKFILLGAPGAGKGTLASLLKNELGIAHISTGDILRDEMKNNSQLGQKVKGYIEQGKLVPDEVVNQIIENRFLTDSKLSKGYMLDGFPRTIAQCQDLDKILLKADKPIDYVVYLESSLPVIIKRLTGRRVCRKCSAVFHISNRPSKKDGVCDQCGGELYQRADDNEETIKTRMEVYMKNLTPILDYYKSQGKLKTMDGDLESETLFETLLKTLHEDGKLNKA